MTPRVAPSRVSKSPRSKSDTFLYSSRQDLQAKCYSKARMQSSYLFETLNSDVMQFSSICVSVMLSSAEDIRESTSN